MSLPDTAEGFYPNNLGRIMLEAFEEVLGHNGVNAVLNLSKQTELINNYPPNNLDREFAFSRISKMMSALEEFYGPLGGRGLAVRSGRASIKYGLREYGALLGLSEPEFKLLPFASKLRKGAVLFTETYNTYTDQRMRVEETEDHIFWHIEKCPMCWGRHSDTGVCHFIIGIVQEALYWLSGGKIFTVEETSCIAKGDPTCTIQCDKEPLE